MTELVRVRFVLVTCVLFLELLSESEDGSHLVMYDIPTGEKESELIPSHKSLQEHCNEMKTSQKVFSQLQVNHIH